MRHMRPQVLGRAQQNPQDMGALRQKDGALLALGSLHERLHKKAAYKVRRHLPEARLQPLHPSHPLLHPLHLFRRLHLSHPPR